MKIDEKTQMRNAHKILIWKLYGKRLFRM